MPRRPDLVFRLVAHIVTRGNAEDLMLLYSIPAFAKGDADAFLSGVARANQLIKKVHFSPIFVFTVRRVSHLSLKIERAVRPDRCSTHRVEGLEPREIGEIYHSLCSCAVIG
jgi:hypothetical protein